MGSSSVAPDRQCICTLCTYQRRGWLEMKCGILLTFSLTLVQCQRPGPGPHGPARRRPRPEQNNRDEIEPTCPSSISGRVSSGVFCPNEDGTISCRGRKDCPKDLSLSNGEDVKYDCREGVCSEISSTCKRKRRGNACKPVFLAIPLDFLTGHAGQSFTQMSSLHQTSGCPASCPCRYPGGSCGKLLGLGAYGNIPFCPRRRQRC